MRLQFSLRHAIGLACSALLLLPPSPLQARAQGGGKKASLSLKASPAVAFAPARLVFVAELRGGDDVEELYCPTVEWDWGDGTTSLAEADCSPYEAGKSQIKRRYTVDHQYKNGGTFRVYLRLKKGTKIVAVANTSIQVRPGLMQPG